MKFRHSLLISSILFPVSSLTILHLIAEMRGYPSMWDSEIDEKRLAIFLGVLVWLFFAVEHHVPNPESWSRKKKFNSPDVPDKLRHKKPEGIVFGRQKGRWICTKERIAHYLILGQSGSGKSVNILSTLLVNAALPEGKKDALFVLDLKGELSYKSITYDDENARIMSINRRTLYGYDLLYKLRQRGEINSQTVISVITQIVTYLVPKPADVKEPFFIDGARNLCSGLMLAGYKELSEKGERVEFIDLVDRILSSSAEEQISHVLKTARPSSPEYRYLVMFSGMIEGNSNATLASVYSQLCNNLTLYANDQNIRWFLKNNPRRVSPDTLYQEKKSLYLTLDESKLEEYSPLTRIILAQMLSAASQLPDNSADNGNHVLMILDEISRVLNGSSDMAKLITGAIKTLRSKGVILCIINQTVSSFHESMSKSAAEDLISNCEYILVLSAKDLQTAKMIEQWCGKFLQKQISIAGIGEKRKDTVSYRDQSIVTVDELLRLQSEKKELLISPYGFFRLDRAEYYRDKNMAERSKKIQKHNDMIANLEQ